MPLPAILAGLGLTEAVWIAIMGVIRLITWIYGIVMVGSYVRDVYTKTKESDIVLDSNDCVEKVLARTDLTPEQKTQLAQECTKGTEKTSEWVYVGLGLLGLGALYFLTQNKPTRRKSRRST